MAEEKRFRVNYETEKDNEVFFADEVDESQNQFMLFDLVFKKDGRVVGKANNVRSWHELGPVQTEADPFDSGRDYRR